ncbi:unnamed protein product [Closterium sp. Naga37s-1]|nr:unnamed protein product [Closterium sp. Naga37s-1]
MFVCTAGVSRSFLSLLASSGARFSSLRLHSVRTAADGTKKVLFELSRDADLTPSVRPHTLSHPHSPRPHIYPFALSRDADLSPSDCSNTFTRPHSPTYAHTPLPSSPLACQVLFELSRDADLSPSDRPRRLGVVETVLIPHRPGRGGEGGEEEEEDEEEGSGSEDEKEGDGFQHTPSFRPSFFHRMGLQRNLTAGEIVDQVIQIRRLFTEEVGPVTNLVFMGMGEPLHNLPAVLTACNTLLDPLGAHCSPARTTVSTCGLVPEMHEFSSHSQASLALSLHATTDEVRSSIMPINKKHNLTSLFACLRQHFPDATTQSALDAGEGGAGLRQQSKKRHVFIEYLMLDGVNDSLEDARRLVALTEGIACKINLIVFNPHPGTALQPSPLPRVLAFQHELVQGGRKAYLRHSRGDDEMAACGQLGQVPRLTDSARAEAAAVIRGDDEMAACEQLGQVPQLTRQNQAEVAAVA